MAAASIEVALVALPNRSLSRRGIHWFVALQTAAMLLVAIYSALRGNVFAPGFILLEAALATKWFDATRAWCARSQDGNRRISGRRRAQGACGAPG